MNTDARTDATDASAIDPLMQDRLARLAERRAAGDRPAAASSPSAAGRSAGPTNRTTAASGPMRKRHAAKGSRAAALLMSIGTTAGLSAYFQHADAASADTTSTVTGVATATGTAGTAATAVTTASTAATAATTASTATTATTAASTSGTAAGTAVAAATTTGSTLADGTYTGATATNKWGPVQVQITVSGGQITEVVALQTPDADHKSVSINARATPVLASEVLAAQSADIDTVSGATYTSDSYKVSLQSAIDLAQSAALQASASA